MALNFFPKVVKFFRLFQEQSDLLTDTAHILSELFDDFNNVAEKGRKIIRNEYAGNDLSREIAKQLSLTFITPIDREDIHALNMAQENVLNSMRAISTRIGLYHFREITPGTRDLISKLKLMIDSVALMLKNLSRKEEVEVNVVKVRETKIEADMLLLVLLGEVYDRQAENNSSLLDMVKWSHIYDRIEDAFAATEVLANTIEGIALKNA